jgi:hypothetical protein
VTKISQLSSIGDSLAIGDQFLIRDIDDAGSPNKSVTVSGITRALADGNATAPALAFAADKNTGIYRAGTDSLAVATNGTGRLFVDASGNVGLGVLNPTSTANGLDISSGGLSLVVGANNTQTTRTNATTKTSRIASFHYTNTEEPVAIAVADSTATSNVIYFGGSTSLCNAATELIFYTAANNTTATGSERLRITSAGLVGIGTSSPDERLHVKATGTQRVDLAKFELAGQRSLLVQGQWGAMDIGTSNGILQYTSGNLGFRTSASGNANMLLDISGRVGIGTTSPATTLDVNGTIACSSTAGGIAFTANSSAVAFSAGLYRPATDNLAFVTGGSEKARLDGSGRLSHGGSEKARLDGSGRLLVGTSTGTHNLGQQLLPVSTTETKSIYRFGNASGLKRKFNLTTVAADRALFSIACGAAGAGNKVALEITVFLTGEKSGVSSDRVFTGKWSVVRGDAGTFTIANVYSAGSAGAATVTASGDNVNINAIFSVVSGGGCFVEIKGLLGTANQGSAENGFTVTMPAI